MTTATAAKRLSLKQQILAYLHQYDPQTGKRRGITQLEAIGLWRCYRLAARIEEMRSDGVDIRTEIKRDTTGKTYARYFLR